MADEEPPWRKRRRLSQVVDMLAQYNNYTSTMLAQCNYARLNNNNNNHSFNNNKEKEDEEMPGVGVKEEGSSPGSSRCGSPRADPCPLTPVSPLSPVEAYFGYRAPGLKEQEQPLDLSLKGRPKVVRGDVASPTTKESVAWRYNLEVSPVVEEMPPGSDVAYVCPVCGQMFSLHDRLAKHMASRHKSRSSASSGGDSGKAYLCEVCERSFARSDMLTRHTRLHTGVKPYTCRVCGQVFSRSDHLSTHQRTHTGEKPYKCPQCPYAACRRDMITRHMRTHAPRYHDTLLTPPAEPPEIKPLLHY